MNRLKLLLGFVISVGLFAALLASVDLHELGAQLRRTHWGWTLVGAALAPAGLWIRAQRWRFLFPPRSDPPGLLAGVMIGYMANNVLPLRAGEVVRVYVVARRWGHGFWTTLATLIVERVLDSLAIVLILAALVLLIPVPPIFQWTAATLLVIDLAAMGALAFVAVAPERCQRLVARLTRRWPRLGERAASVFSTFVRGLDGIRTPAHVLPLLAWTVAVWLAPALAAWTMLRAVNLS
ncbi:MAG: flippase-like domain-containing protein, partial [Candidatus Rokubacteria bacterium]|nr:flippase-like domain-containing protein [Candidatus Rokubacteria bacterium]